MNDLENDGFIDCFDGYDEIEAHAHPAVRKQNRERKRLKAKANHRTKTKQKPAGNQYQRVESRDGTFRCKHCKTVVGKPISGGRHRNHCPLCLYSRHVDLKTPGDRASTCRSLMVATGLFTRRDGEQVLVHECLGCGVLRHNRVAADDNVMATMRLPVVTDSCNEGERETRAQSA